MILRTIGQVLASLAVAGCPLSATELYYLDFTPPEVGAYQTVRGNPSVQSSAGPLTDALVFHAVARNEQIRLPITVSSPRYLIEYDVLAHNLLSSQYAFTTVLDTSSGVRNVGLHGGVNGVHVFQPSPYTLANVAGFNNDQVYHFAIFVDLEFNRWSVAIDGTQRFVNAINASSVQAIRFSMGPWSGGALDAPSIYAALDNVRIEAVSGTTPPTVTCPGPLILECADVGTLEAGVLDTSGNPLQVVWTVDGTPYQTNDIPAGGSFTLTNVRFAAEFGVGVHEVVVSASNGQTTAATCSTTVTVGDTTPPGISSLAATPNVLWPPNHRMISVTVTGEAVDACDPSPHLRIVDVMSNEAPAPFASDFEITGARTVNLRAERSAKGTGRVYTILVQAEDEQGNISLASVNVTVPKR